MSPRPAVTTEEMLTPGEVADIYKVNVKTVTAWAVKGDLRFIRTLGGHRRYFASDFEHLRRTP
jgi:excisionase family DNA binding protein